MFKRDQEHLTRWVSNQLGIGYKSFTFSKKKPLTSRQPGWDVPAAGRRRSADGERAPGGTNELRTVEVQLGGGPAEGQSGHGCAPSRPEEWVISIFRLCVCVCLIVVRAKRLNMKERFKGCSPGLTMLLKLWALLNCFDTLNWCVSYCEVIHEWYHDS